MTMKKSSALPTGDEQRTCFHGYRALFDSWKASGLATLEVFPTVRVGRLGKEYEDGIYFNVCFSEK